MTSPDPVREAEAYRQSALECIGHVTDRELLVAGRYRWIHLAQARRALDAARG